MCEVDFHSSKFFVNGLEIWLLVGVTCKRNAIWEGVCAWGGGGGEEAGMHTLWKCLHSNQGSHSDKRLDTSPSTQYLACIHEFPTHEVMVEPGGPGVQAAWAQALGRKPQNPIQNQQTHVKTRDIPEATGDFRSPFKQPATTLLRDEGVSRLSRTGNWHSRKSIDQPHKGEPEKSFRQAGVTTPFQCRVGLSLLQGFSSIHHLIQKIHP